MFTYMLTSSRVCRGGVCGITPKCKITQSNGVAMVRVLAYVPVSSSVDLISYNSVPLSFYM